MATHVINPNTQKLIKIDGPTYKRLLKLGQIKKPEITLAEEIYNKSLVNPYVPDPREELYKRLQAERGKPAEVKEPEPEPVEVTPKKAKKQQKPKKPPPVVIPKRPEPEPAPEPEYDIEAEVNNLCLEDADFEDSD